MNNPTIAGSGTMRIDAGGTLSIDGGRDDTAIFISYPVELRGGTMTTDLFDGFVADSGSTISGGGTVGGKLTALSGSVVRVGREGLSAPARFVIDNLESYAPGNVRDVASPPWTAHQNTSLADIESSAGNKVLTFGWANDFRGTSRDLPEIGTIDNGEVATFFFRFNSKTDDPDHSFGLGGEADTGVVNFDNYETQIRVTDNPSATGTYMLDARSGGGFSGALATGLVANAWYNVWVVVDQAADTYDIYLNTGTGDATAGNKLNAAPLDFRNGTSQPLNKILGLAASAPIDNAVRYDDLVYLTGADLSNPLAGLDPGLVLSPETLMVQGDLVLNAGATLELDVFAPGTVDVLEVQGALIAGGTLEVRLDAAAPAPQAGDVFDILDFASASGAFAALNLPSLTAGLEWNTDNLLSTGILQVVASLPGDYNTDGKVDAADYVVWRKNGASQDDYNTWRANFGGSGGSGSSSFAAVPEPGTLLLGCCAFSAVFFVWNGYKVTIFSVLNRGSTIHDTYQSA
jgi:hypothetical protein